MMFIPIDIPAVYFPLALYGLFFLLGGVDMGSLISIGFGYAYGYGYIPSSMMLSNEYVSQVLESSSSGNGSGGILGGGHNTPTQCCLRCTRWLEGFVASSVIARMVPYPGFIMAGAATGSADSLAPASHAQQPPSRPSAGNRLSDSNPPASGSFLSGISSYFGSGSNADSNRNTAATNDGELQHSVPNGGFSSLFNTRGAGDNLGRYAPVSGTNELEGGIESEPEARARDRVSGSAHSTTSNPPQTSSRATRSSREDRELIAAKRIAALGGGVTSTSSVESGDRSSNAVPNRNANVDMKIVPSAPPVPAPTVTAPTTTTSVSVPFNQADFNLNLQMLGDMGFSEIEAKSALEKCGNDLNRAISMLT